MSPAQSVQLSPTAGAHLLTARVNKLALRSFTLDELLSLSQGLRTIADVTNGVTNTPRYIQDGSCVYNAPGDVLDTVLELLDGMLDDVEREATRRSPEALSEDDREKRAWIIIQGHSMRLDTMRVVRDVAVFCEDMVSADE
ncbi:hypothetical protein LUX29_21425 [Aureimonas altamirensis]|uniref:hypothetical protein n=1 Tax=Aureimonas altamirensis TaxID=370622 RepID=UPI001E391441|nr:hypothetical protein [Aureimonas altamirensis]UHD45516.1 hypothetical protein LUX29_21425 [Aureimonas altamirensis]